MDTLSNPTALHSTEQEAESHPKYQIEPFAPILLYLSFL